MRRSAWQQTYNTVVKLSMPSEHGLTRYHQQRIGAGSQHSLRLCHACRTTALHPCCRELLCLSKIRSNDTHSNPICSSRMISNPWSHRVSWFSNPKDSNGKITHSSPGLISSLLIHVTRCTRQLVAGITEQTIWHPVRRGHGEGSTKLKPVSSGQSPPTPLSQCT